MYLIFVLLVISRFRSGEIRRDTVNKYSGIQQIQLDIIVRYKRDIVDTVGYSGIKWIYCKMARYR